MPHLPTIRPNSVDASMASILFCCGRKGRGLTIAGLDRHIGKSGQTIDSVDTIDDAQTIATIPHVDGASVNDHRRRTTADIHYQ